MNILFVVPAIEETGGVASVVRRLALILRRRGHEVLLLTMARKGCADPVLTKEGIATYQHRFQLPFGSRPPFVSIAAFGFFLPLGLLQIASMIRRHKIQVVDIHYPAEPFFYFYLCRQFLSFRLVLSVHGADLFPDGKAPARYPRLLGRLLQSSDLIVAPSNGFRKQVTGRLPELEKKAVVIHNGIDIHRFFEKSGNFYQRQTTRVLSVSAYKNQKGLDVLIRAFQKVHMADPGARLVLVGDGPLRKDLMFLAASLGLQDDIEFLGRQTEDSVRNLLQECTVFVLPSRFETFGIAILEAMASAKPVIATSVGGIPEIVESGRNGILIPPDDPDALATALICLLSDPARQAILGLHALETVRRFTAERMATQYEDAFCRLLQPASGIHCKDKFA